MIKVMIVDDQPLIRDGIKMILSLNEDIEVMAEAENGNEAIQKLNELNIDVILMDVRMPVLNGVEATKIIKKNFKNIKVIILTTFKDDEYLFEALKNGADGYILKDVKSDEIIEAIKTVYTGNLLIQSEMASKMVKFFNNSQNSIKEKEEIKIKGPYENLTQREIEIAILISEGNSNKEISEKLFITEGTVKNHLTRILSKLQLRDRTQLALYINKTLES
jgi:DNA-binding NarL/FixJ family response regulator